MRQPHIGPTPIGPYIGMSGAGMTRALRFQALPHPALGASKVRAATHITLFDYQ
jgi:hypothetical protein